MPDCSNGASGIRPNWLRPRRLIHDGVVADYAELARPGKVSRARLTQVMNLLLLAPDIQEAILFLPRVVEGGDPVSLRKLQAVALVADWSRQRKSWDANSTNVTKS